VGLHELLAVRTVEKADSRNTHRVAELFATGLEEGMRTLKQDWYRKGIGPASRYAPGARSLH